MYLLIDNYDSFVYNLAAYIRELSSCVEVIRNDCVDMAELKRRINLGEIDGIIISPGPKRPEDSGCSEEIIRRFEGIVPILGVCLGHQTIAYRYGGTVRKGLRPMHGKITEIRHNRSSLFSAIPQKFQVTRYHSLVVSPEDLPDCLEIDACTDDQTIMALHHRDYPVYGIQFHPEAVLTEYGHQIIRNFMSICEGRKICPQQ